MPHFPKMQIINQIAAMGEPCILTSPPPPTLPPPHSPSCPPTPPPSPPFRFLITQRLRSASFSVSLCFYFQLRSAEFEVHPPLPPPPPHMFFSPSQHVVKHVLSSACHLPALFPFSLLPALRFLFFFFFFLSFFFSRCPRVRNRL